MNFIYDSETYPNFFSIGFMNAANGERRTYEISDRRNDGADLAAFVTWASNTGATFVGFNNLGFDYPVLHHWFLNWQPGTGPEVPYAKAMEIINSGFEDRFKHNVWPSDQVVKQLDLFKIHHFDNVARATSLKVLEFNMRSPSVEDLPFAPGTELTDEQKDITLAYMWTDICETARFAEKSSKMIDFRTELSAKYGRDFMNHNDTKIGKDYFIMRLEEAGVACFTRARGFREPVQTIRPRINLADVIFSYVSFEHPEFNRVLEWMKSQTIRSTKGVLDDVTAVVNGFEFVFGTGGIHGSVEGRRVYADDEHSVIDLDVTSYYPSLAIANRVYPEHLGETFCDIYADVKAQRVNYAKGTPENAMMKLALNGVYGDSNNTYSPFYDPQYTMTITINGQLLLCMLAERIMLHPQIEMIQINTDGLTVRCHKSAEPYLQQVCEWWQALTQLQLEVARYSRMFIRDVNNYIAEYEDGKLKRKGAYEYEREWHQNQSCMVVPKAAEAALVRGVPVSDFIRQHADGFDFMGRTKVPRNSKLLWGEQQVQNVTRYYIARDGKPLTKVMPPTQRQVAAGKTDDRRMAIEKGWLTGICDNVRDFDGTNINYLYYIKEASKLVDTLV